MNKTHAHSIATIKLGLFEQNNGWVFVAVPFTGHFYDEPLFSGKRKSLADAIDAAKVLAGEQIMVYCRLDNVSSWDL